MQGEWLNLGISVRRSTGEEKTYCPRCRNTRKNTRDKSLSVNHDKGVYNCHHCNWGGTIGKGFAPVARQIERRTYTRPSYTPTPQTQQPATDREKLIAFFAKRGISEATLNLAQIELRDRRIAFPYMRGGIVVNVKYRTVDKQFMLEKGAEPLFYGYDIASEGEPQTLFVVEGEIDALSCWEAGITNVVSVPTGAKTNLDLIADCEGWLDSFEDIVFAGDNDAAGLVLANELQRRLGVEKSWRVEWPEDCKDANDVLVKHGADKLRECLDNPYPVPVEGAYHAGDYEQQVLHHYEIGRDAGLSTGWAGVDPYYRVAVGEWTVVTGTPGSGKSFWLMNLAINLAKLHDWRFVVYPPENLPADEYLSSLLEIYHNRPFDRGATARMSREQVTEGMRWLHEHFVILDPGENEQTLDKILEQARVFVKRWGANGLILDPWNEIDHDMSKGETETLYTGTALRKFGRFVRLNQLHGWIAAHPRIMTKDKDGRYPVPTLYDISGSANWNNKTHMGVVLWRDMENENEPTQMHVQKVKRRWHGKVGMALLKYLKVSGVFQSIEPPMSSDNGVKRSSLEQAKAFVQEAGY